MRMRRHFARVGISPAMLVCGMGMESCGCRGQWMTFSFLVERISIRWKLRMYSRSILKLPRLPWQDCQMSAGDKLWRDLVLQHRPLQLPRHSPNCAFGNGSKPGSNLRDTTGSPHEPTHR